MPKLRLYIGFEQVSQVHHTDSHRSQNHVVVKAKDGQSSSHREKHAFQSMGNKQQTQSLNGLRKTFLFYPTENSLYSTSYSNTLTTTDPYVMKSRIPSVSLTERK